ncbi:hypothetical protein [Streptomyces sp. CBMA29]|uniref:hypothetical protein n=1 Tax=Streptomyces sp. CBMA29 TaxID=1896314 RepID=UPI0016619399|nr:hypothetical protein [Streptomyces sp. CBMA29]
MDLQWIPTPDVRVGDRIALLLSDAQDYPVITGWTDRTLDLERHGLGSPVHRTWRVRWAPWWAFDMLTDGLDGESLIVYDVDRVTFTRTCSMCSRMGLPTVFGRYDGPDVLCRVLCPGHVAEVCTLVDREGSPRFQWRMGRGLYRNVRRYGCTWDMTPFDIAPLQPQH